MVNSRRHVSGADDTGDTEISRRSVLAAGGIVIFGGLSGCLGRVASAVTNTGASPAAVFAGRSGDGDATTLGDPRVSRLTPTLAAGSGAVSGEVELEGWVTSSAVEAQDYNSSRSNKPSRAADEDSDGDGVGDGTDGARANYNNTRSNKAGIARPPDILDDELDTDNETVRVVSRLDTELQEETVAAWRSISKRSARTGRNPQTGRNSEPHDEISAGLESMAETLSEMRGELERCSDDVCALALENVAGREADVRRAQEYAADGAWTVFGVTDEDEDDILTGDYLLPPATFNPSGLFSPEEQGVLYRYLDGETMVGERFTVCLPDAEVPGGSESIRAAVTPQRFIDYMTGRTDGEGRVYSWGDADSDADRVGDCDDTDEDVRPGTVCGTTPHFVAALSGPVSTGGSLEVIRGDDETVVVSDHQTPPGLERVCAVVASDDACGPDVWERPSLPSSGSGVSVFQVMVQPPECPHAFPALLYVQQCRNDDQLIYTGGWLIDDSALYEHAITVLGVAGPTEVVSVGLGDVDGDGFGDLVERSVSSDRAMRGARVDSGSVESLVEAGVLPRGTITGDEYGFVTNIDLSAPILHLTNAGDASNEVKFKAGAELSGQVN